MPTQIFTYQWKRFQELGLIALLGLFFSFVVFDLANSQNRPLLENENLYAQMDFDHVESEVSLLSIKFSNFTIQEALELLSNKVNVGFSYNPEIIPDKRISLSMTKVPPHEVIYKLLEGTNLEPVLPPSKDVIVIREKEVLPKIDVFQQTVEGRVTDANTGEALTGVTIVAPGTNIGTTTDLNGDYSLTVPDETEALVFSYVGYLSQEVQINGRSEINIELQEEVIAMDEAVVTAFGLEREQRSITSSIGQVSAEDIAQGQDLSVANSLSGRVAGVQVQSAGSGTGGSSRVIIRGFSSLGGNNQPLYVVDGVPIDNSNRGSAGRWGGYDRGDGIQNINPNDIADISVLKGPSAASLYGQRGANGVVLITTKSGQSREGIGVELNSSVSVGSPSVWPDWQNEYGLGSNGQHRFFRDGNGDVRSRTDWEAAGQPNWTPQLTTAADGPQHPKSWGPAMDGSQVFNWDGQSVTFSPQPDNAKNFFSDQVTVDNTLSFSGGNETTTFRLSLSDMQNQGVLPTNELTRRGVNLRAAHQISERFSAEGKVNYVRQEAYNRAALSDDQENVFYQFRGMPRSTIGSTLDDYIIGPDEEMVGYAASINQEGFPKHWSNATHTEQPHWIINNIINEDTRERVIGHVSLNYQFTDWLGVQARASTDFYTDRRHNHAAIGTRTPGQGTGTLSEQVHRFREDNMEVLLSANQSITDDLSVTANLGGNYKRDYFNNTNFSGQQLAVGGLYVISNAQIQNPGYSLSETEIQSIFVFGQFNWQDILYFDWSARNDWASTLPTDNNSVLYPSFGLNFVFSDAFDMPDFLTFGSVRGSWAQAGNTGDPYQLSGNYSLTSNPHLGQPGATFQNSVPFTDLQNELTTSTEIGADLRFLEGRVRLDAGWYWSSTENQILNIPVSSATGYYSQSVNAGEIKNDGFELMIEASPIVGSEFQWNIAFNYGKNNNEVVELIEGIDRFQLGSARNVAVYADPGQPYGAIYTTTARYLRDDNGNRLIDQSGLPIRESGEFLIGNAMPDWTGGISNTFNYKNFSLSALVDIQKGGDIFSISNMYEAIYGTTKATTEGRDGSYVAEGVSATPDGNGGWTSTGQANTVQVRAEDYWNRVAPEEGSAVTEEFLNDGTYVKMRELRLGYEIPTSLTQSIGMNRLRVAVIGKNLFYFVRNTDGFAPESHNRNVNASSLGMEDNSWPSLRSVVFNVNIGF
ncbi:SusC/RagA family TonB-linked outer membrane protein [Rhodohalobacter sp. 8-1]|uniref:SusC/RagA family TonB-linked outer membrane protein n=1 Tax=Rhodohalobacter sp. 8-1 TaxID=3131972 RepID=UPI0030EC9951